MAKAKFERTKPHVNIGTIGHVDPSKAENLLGFRYSACDALVIIKSTCNNDPLPLYLTSAALVFIRAKNG